MKGTGIPFFAGMVLAICFAASALAETRLALVIGNSAYRHAPVLANSVNDAKLMTRTLEQVGFSVKQVLDGSRDDMRREMLAFSRSLRQPNTVGLFYFAGHGVQLNGMNYFVPVDADLQSEEETRLQTVDISEFLATLDALNGSEGRVNIIILDACRNNPFSRGWRAATQGLAPIESPTGTLVAFSTAPGKVSFDGDGGNSPYTRALAQAILTPGLPVEQVFKDVRVKVKAATSDKQTPWENTSLTGNFYFVPQGKVVAALQALSPSPQAPDAVETPPALSAQAPAAVLVTTPAEEKRAIPAAPQRQGGGCTALPAKLVAPIAIQEGTVFCPKSGGDTAIIKRITPRTVVYSVNGGYEISCSTTDLCQFNWASGAPLFNVRIQSDISGGVAASLVAPK